MKPITLSFGAFGPYLQRQTIDFRRFYENGLFLIHGQTGGGKTFLLDAISFALYGKSSGGMREDLRSMRCQLAGEGDITFVDFEFETGGRRYRFRRRMWQRRKRGGAVAMETDQDALFWNETEWNTFFENPKSQSVTKKAEELIGLNYEQFRKVILLPQGQFETLLVAGSEEKEKILVQLFQAQRWSRTAERLMERVRAKEQETQKKQVQIQTQLEQFQCGDLDQLKQRCQQEKDMWQEQEKEAERLQGQWQLFQGEKKQAVQLEELWNKKEELARQCQQLLERKEEMEQLEKRLLLANRAQALQSLYESQRELNFKIQEKGHQREGRKEEIKQLKQQAEQSETERRLLEERLAQMEDIRRKLPLWEEMEQRLRTLEKEASVYEQTSREQTALQEQRQRMDEEREEALQEAQKLKEALKEIKEDSSELLRLTKLVVEGEQKEKEYAAYEEAKKKRQEAQKTWQKLSGEIAIGEKEVQAAQERYERYLRAYLDNMSGALALTLQEGAPCPVCGSLHHPCVARTESEAVSQETLEEARVQLESKKEELEKQKRRQAAVEAGLKDELVPVEFDREQLLLWNSQLQQLRQAEQNGKRLQEQLDQLEEKQNQLLGESERLAQEIQARQAICIAAGARRKTLEDAIDPAFKSSQELLQYRREKQEQWNEFSLKLEDKVKDCQEKKERLERLQAVEQQMEKEQQALEAEWEEKKKRYLQERSAQGFSSDQEVETALADGDKREQIQSQVQQYTVDRRTKEEMLGETERQIGTSPRPDMDQITRQEEELSQRREACLSQLALKKDAFERINQAVVQLEKKMQDAAQEKQENVQMLAFARLVRGDTGIGLQRYVLGVMLSMITGEANRLLKNVHDGRYQLQRTMERSGKARKAGLELEVYDSLSGEKRSVTSLSGGEKFLVSLSLALGLSMVVQRQAGGIRMEAMFIDEGFGSLDSGSVQDALGVLAAFQRAGGLIGIISHVQQLRETIPVGIEVVKKRSGSELKLRG